MQRLLEKLRQIVGDDALESDAAALEPHLTEWRGIVRGASPVMVSPSTREQVAAVVRTCAEANVGVVPQGGNTGMCAAAVPDASGTQIILNLRRMNRIRSIDPLDFSMIVEAGCVLADIRAAAAHANRLFPLSHGGEGSAQIGGNLSTNAGGINVLRYGTTRDLVLGVEVVLADGRVWDGIKTLRKDTAGYDLKHLFIGSEGTLGILTAAAIKLYPAVGAADVALIALDDVADAVVLLNIMREQLPGQVQAFELIGRRAFELVLEHVPATTLPFETSHAWYVLCEVGAAGDGGAFAQALAGAAGRGVIDDAVIAKNDAESSAFWRMRHAIAEAEKRAGPSAKHDISVPVGKISEFIVEAERRLRDFAPQVDIVVFGHVGDGNLHYNARVPKAPGDAEQRHLSQDLSGIVYDLTTEMGGSISAEHGIGVLKKAFLAHYKSDVEIGLMRSLKAALDPHNTLNPGKVI